MVESGETIQPKKPSAKRNPPLSKRSAIYYTYVLLEIAVAASGGRCTVGTAASRVVHRWDGSLDSVAAL